MRAVFYFSIGLMLLFFWSCNHKNLEIASQPYNDSIKKYLDLASNDTLPFKIRDAYNQKAFSFIDLSKNDTLVRWYLFKVFVNYNNTKNLSGISKVRNRFIQKYSKTNDNLALGILYRINGSYFTKIKRNDSAFYYIEKSIKSYKKTYDVVSLGEMYFKRGCVQNNISDYLGAEFSLKQALILFKKKKMYRSMYSVYNELGNIYNSLKEHDDALKCHEQALDLVFKYKLKSSIESNLVGTSLNNIGNIYREKGDYYNATFYFKRALNNKSFCANDKLLKGYLYENLSICYLKLNRNNNVLEMLKKSDLIFREAKVYKESAIVNMYISQYYLKIRNYVKAKEFSEIALDLGKKSGEYYYYLTILSNAGIANKEKAPQYLLQYHHLNDSLISSERKKRSQFYKIQLETNEITQEKEKAVKQKWVVTYVVSGIMIIIILLFIIFRQKAKQKELQLLQDQQKSNEEMYQLLINQHVKEEEARQNEKKRIAIELHDNVMNQLASTRFNLYSISQKTDKQTIEKALTYIDKIKDIENEIRDITHNLSNDIFTGTYSFKSILEELIDEQNKTYTATLYKLELDTNIDWEVISGKVKMNLYRMLQELVYNINKHAQATFSVISIVLESNNICMAVQDNGKGFVVSSSVNGIGLKNIEQRLKEVQGKMNIRSSVGKGTTVFVMIPI